MNMRSVALLVLLFAIVLPAPSILSAAATPKEVDEEPKETKSNYELEDSRSRCCCGGWSYGRCGRWCCNPNEAVANAMPENLEAADKQSNLHESEAEEESNNPEVSDEKYRGRGGRGGRGGRRGRGGRGGGRGRGRGGGGGGGGGGGK